MLGGVRIDRHAANRIAEGGAGSVMVVRGVTALSAAASVVLVSVAGHPSVSLATDTR